MCGARVCVNANIPGGTRDQKGGCLPPAVTAVTCVWWRGSGLSLVPALWLPCAALPQLCPSTPLPLSSIPPSPSKPPSRGPRVLKSPQHPHSRQPGQGEDKRGSSVSTAWESSPNRFACDESKWRNTTQKESPFGKTSQQKNTESHRESLQVFISFT